MAGLRRWLVLTAVAAGSLVASPATAQQGVDAGRFGPWRVWCAVDGALAGFDRPECRASASFGDTGVELTRTASGIEIVVNDKRCRGVAAGARLSQSRLADPSAGARRLQSAIVGALARCAKAAAIERGELRRVLRATAAAL